MSSYNPFSSVSALVYIYRLRTEAPSSPDSARYLVLRMRDMITDSAHYYWLFMMDHEYTQVCASERSFALLESF